MTTIKVTDLYIKTPLLHSKILSDIVSTPVYLKLENVQLSNSFKLRGFSQACVERLKQGGCEGFVTFSAGNGGLSLAYTCHLLEKPCHIFVPSFASPRMLEKIRSYGAIVHMTSSGNECYEKALAMSTENPQWALIHPHENPEVWNGYSEMIAEIKADLPKDTVPSCIVASVGGGGLLMGILKGIDLIGWRTVPVVAMETIGADNFSKSLKAGKLILNDPMTSVAKTLGAPYITSHLIDLAKHFNVISSTLPDERAVEACLKFSDDHIFLVEPAAGVSLATVYSNVLPQILEQKGFNISAGPVVIIVCGGNDINAEILMRLAKDLKIVA